MVPAAEDKRLSLILVVPCQGIGQRIIVVFHGGVYGHSGRLVDHQDALGHPFDFCEILPGVSLSSEKLFYPKSVLGFRDCIFYGSVHSGSPIRCEISDVR